jgi:hypothetical protein
MSMIQQLLTVAGILVALPFAVKLLWRLYLFPAGCWFVATQLFWPKWASANKTLCAALLVGCVLYFLGAWINRYRMKKRQEKEWLDHVLKTAPVLEYRPKNAFHGETQ